MKTFPEQSPWEIGAAKAPVEFEPENVAGMARSKSDKSKIHSKMKEAIKAMEAGGLPWHVAE